MRDLITVSFTIIQLGCYSQLQQTTNPFGQYQEEEKHRISQVDSLEIIADSENARREYLITQRERLNEINVDDIYTTVIITVQLRLTINADGQVVSAQSIPIEGTTTDQRIVDRVITAAKSQLHYSKEPDIPLQVVWYTVKIVPN